MNATKRPSAEERLRVDRAKLVATGVVERKLEAEAFIGLNIGNIAERLHDTYLKSKMGGAFQLESGRLFLLQCQPLLDGIIYLGSGTTNYKTTRQFLDDNCNEVDYNVLLRILVLFYIVMMIRHVVGHKKEETGAPAQNEVETRPQGDSETYDFENFRKYEEEKLLKYEALVLRKLRNEGVPFARGPQLDEEIEVRDIDFEDNVKEGPLKDYLDTQRARSIADLTDLSFDALEITKAAEKPSASGTPGDFGTTSKEAVGEAPGPAASVDAATLQRGLPHLIDLLLIYDELIVLREPPQLGKRRSYRTKYDNVKGAIKNSEFKSAIWDKQGWDEIKDQLSNLVRKVEPSFLKLCLALFNP